MKKIINYLCLSGTVVLFSCSSLHFKHKESLAKIIIMESDIAKKRIIDDCIIQKLSKEMAAKHSYEELLNYGREDILLQVEIKILIEEKRIRC